MNCRRRPLTDDFFAGSLVWGEVVGKCLSPFLYALAHEYTG